MSNIHAATPRIIATFHPQVWIGDYAVEAEPLGPNTCDLTDLIAAMTPDEQAALRDDQYASDDLRFAAVAPDWWADWLGPFYIEVEDSIEKWEAARAA